jgi:hypothetical protein
MVCYEWKKSRMDISSYIFIKKDKVDVTNGHLYPSLQHE